MKFGSLISFVNRRKGNIYHSFGNMYTKSNRLILSVLNTER